MMADMAFWSAASSTSPSSLSIVSHGNCCSAECRYIACLDKNNDDFDMNKCLAHVWQPKNLRWIALAAEQDCSFQSQHVCFDSETSILQWSFNSKTPRDSKNAFLHWGNVLGLCKALFSEGHGQTLSR